jgi:DNA-binding IclR family transcriptional regulator
MSDTGDGDRSAYSYYEPPKTFVKSAIRVINVLEYFYRDRQPARAVEISRELDLPVSSAKYLLTSLVESGYLTFDKSAKTYFPSILFSGFASWLAEIYPSGEVLRELAKEIHQELKDVVSIVVQHENNMRALIIEKDGSETPPAYDFRARIPMTGSASGSIALASKSDVEVAAVAAQESRKLPPNLRAVQGDQLLAQIRAVRQRGYAIKEHHVTLDGRLQSLIAVAIAIPVAPNYPPMALGICGSREKLLGREADVASAMQTIVEKYRSRLES